MVALNLIIAAAAFGCSGVTDLPRGALEQDGAKVDVGSTPPPEPASPGKAAGRVLPLRLEGDLKESVVTHPAPEIWLIFTAPARRNVGQGADQAEGLKVELPPQAVSILRVQWKAVLTSRYKQDVEGLPDAESFRREDGLIARASLDALQGLTKVPINAPDGERTISWREAEDLVHFINTTSSDLVRQAKDHKGSQGS
jgi:hypothetical protein